MKSSPAASKGLFVVISGPSGAGKGTIIDTIMREMPDLSFSVSATTRPQRENETDGVHYDFIGVEEFERRIEKNEFLEWAQVHGHYYGTPKTAVEKLLLENRDVVLDIDVLGSLQVKKIYPEGIFIFIAPPSFSELRKRLLLRQTEKPEEISTRLLDAKEELRCMEEYHYLVVNEVLSDAVADVKSIIRAEKLKISRRLDEVKHALSPD